MDGILGMWSGQHGTEEGLHVPFLYETGVINEKTFSFYMAHTDGIDNFSGYSYIDFGEPNEALFNVNFIVFFATQIALALKASIRMTPAAMV